ncbi:MAG TPA: ATP-binding protein, partial [Polyangiales bacterium]|nr:ATP-binding protein [Polyangiales bacterium]
MAAVAPSNSARSPGNALRLRAPLVGRDHELALLENALNDAITQRSPRTMLVLGSAGVGKSRLTRELLADIRVRHPEVRVLSGQCREGGERMGVMRALLRNRLGLQEGMDAETAANALRETV